MSNQLLAGAVAGAVEALVTMPFEVIKIRQQLGDKKNSSLLVSSTSLKQQQWKNSFRFMYSGLSLQMFQNSGKIGIRFFTYRQLNFLSGGGKNYKIISGFASGVIESLVWISPCERIKILRIKNSNKPIKFIFQSVKTDGYLSLWTGASPTVLRNGLTVGFRFYIYDQLTSKNNEFYRINNAALAGAITGVISTCLNNPIDVLKTEMQSKNSSFKHESIISGVKYLVSKKGVSFLFTAGLYARVFKISIGQAVIFQIIEWM